MPEYPEIEYIAGALRTSRVAVVLGSGASLDPANDISKPWHSELRGMPSASQLAALLSESFRVRHSSLSQTAQLAETFRGTEDLRSHINEIFSRRAEPLASHSFCASLAAWRLTRRLAEDKLPDPLPPRLYCPLFMTTNYDTLIEDALIRYSVPFDLLRYDVPDQSGDARLAGAALADVGTEKRVCVVKMHGSASAGASRSEPDPPPFVITEDDYIAYLASVHWDDYFPTSISGYLTHCHYLFLGHSLTDWNLRVMLHQITRKSWRGRTDYKIWAVKKSVEEFEKRWANSNSVELIEADLSDFIPKLERAVTCLTQVA